MARQKAQSETRKKTDSKVATIGYTPRGRNERSNNSPKVKDTGTSHQGGAAREQTNGLLRMKAFYKKRWREILLVVSTLAAVVAACTGLMSQFPRARPAVTTVEVELGISDFGGSFLAQNTGSKPCSVLAVIAEVQSEEFEIVIGGPGHDIRSVPVGSSFFRHTELPLLVAGHSKQRVFFCGQIRMKDGSQPRGLWAKGNKSWTPPESLGIEVFFDNRRKPMHTTLSLAADREGVTGTLIYR